LKAEDQPRSPLPRPIFRAAVPVPMECSSLPVLACLCLLTGLLRPLREPPAFLQPKRHAAAGRQQPLQLHYSDDGAIQDAVLSPADLAGLRMHAPPLPARGLGGPAPREVDRELLHPLFGLGLVDEVSVRTLLRRARGEEGPAAAAAWALPALAAGLLAALALPVLPLLAAARAEDRRRVCADSRARHRVAFEATVAAYRRGQRSLVEALLAARAPGAQRDPLLPAAGAGRVIAVTMATGQEGSAVVRELALGAAHAGAVVRALVRDPGSEKARALAALSPCVELVACDSTDVASLRRALQGANAAYLCTTLNRASAGRWAMDWDGGRYELQQGAAFAEAARGLPGLAQVVYGTAPLRKWPEAFEVEPPIHYACKWRVEEMLAAAGLPLTLLRKCPYHENFTKLTKLDTGAPAAPGAPAPARPGTYSIKALTPPHFEYNTMDPRDIGAWAAIALEHPSLLLGESLSVAADCLSGTDMAAEATASGAFGEGVAFEYHEQPRWLFETLAWVEPTFVYISGLQRWNSDGAAYDLGREDVARLRRLHAGTTWREHLRREGLGQFTATMSELLPDAAKAL